MRYRSFFIGTLVVTAVAVAACGGKKKDAAYYMEMGDSIRKAEQVKQLHKQAGIYSDPVEAWFDTLSLRTLPLQSAGAEYWEIGHFVAVPMSVNEHFGCNVSRKLRALAMPSAYRKEVVLVADITDSIAPRLVLYVMDKRHQPIDHLTLYEKKSEDRSDDFGETFMEYFITSTYEITLLRYYQSHRAEQKPELLESRRYLITKEGRFEETIIEIE